MNRFRRRHALKRAIRRNFPDDFGDFCGVEVWMAGRPPDVEEFDEWMAGCGGAKGEA